MVKRVCFIVSGYPTRENPEYAFIRPVVAGLADQGIDCTVIAPQSVMKSFVRNKSIRPTEWNDVTENGNTIKIFQPKYISFSNIKIGNIHLSTLCRDYAIITAYEKLRIKSDVLYAHFWDCGIVAAKIAQKNKIPLIVASGESVIRVFNYYSKKYVDKYLEYIDGIIFVSSKNKKESEMLGLLKDDVPYVILPNGYSSKNFYHIPKSVARKELNFHDNDFIGVFVGAFIERKGPNRVIESAKKIPNLKLIMIGTGETLTDSNQVIYSGKVPHNDIVKYLNAADFFILPTLAEGCCNAIIEAMACGLPIISSNMDFNDDILDDSCSLRIDPSNNEEIANAMRLLFENKILRENISNGALIKSHSLDIDKRVVNIKNFINDIVKTFN